MKTLEKMMGICQNDDYASWGYRTLNKTKKDGNSYLRRILSREIGRSYLTLEEKSSRLTVVGEEADSLMFEGKEPVLNEMVYIARRYSKDGKLREILEGSKVETLYKKIDSFVHGN